MRRLFLIALTAFILTLMFIPLFSGCSTVEPLSNRVAIIDQLSTTQTNRVFLDEVAPALEKQGLQVDVYRGEDVTVKLLRELPEYGYRLIIFRAHAGLLRDMKKAQITIPKKTFLVTGEDYSQNKYIKEQLTEQMMEAAVGPDYPSVFAINSKFITNTMKGNFDNAVVVMMGCSGIFLPDMAEAFIAKGGSTYLGWNGSLTLDYGDKATASLINKLYTKEMTVQQAVSETMTEIGPDPEHKSLLRYYPPKSGSCTVNALVSGAY